MFKERRKHSRYQCDLRLSVEIGDTTFKTTECSNISMGGMCIVVDDKVDKTIKYGTLTLVQRKDEEEISFNVKLLILWSNFKYVDRRDTLIGVKFKGLDPENSKKLKKIISSQ
jgi:c-di-GMP-binding flagellar brake protein YcgR